MKDLVESRGRKAREGMQCGDHTPDAPFPKAERHAARTITRQSIIQLVD
ncbi:MAG: hypothetical protein U1E58_03825 [Tabrizicola sp.]